MTEKCSKRSQAMMESSDENDSSDEEQENNNPSPQEEEENMKKKRKTTDHLFLGDDIACSSSCDTSSSESSSSSTNTSNFSNFSSSSFVDSLLSTGSHSTMSDVDGPTQNLDDYFHTTSQPPSLSTINNTNNIIPSFTFEEEVQDDPLSNNFPSQEVVDDHDDEQSQASTNFTQSSTIYHLYDDDSSNEYSLDGTLTRLFIQQDITLESLIDAGLPITSSDGNDSGDLSSLPVSVQTIDIESALNNDIENPSLDDEDEPNNESSSLGVSKEEEEEEQPSSSNNDESLMMIHSEATILQTHPSNGEVVRILQNHNVDLNACLREVQQLMEYSIIDEQFTGIPFTK